MKGSAVLNVSASSTGSPWLNLPIAENSSRQSTSPPARSPNFLRTNAERESENRIEPTREWEWRGRHDKSITIRHVRVGDELGLGAGVPGLLYLDDALEGHAVVGDADEDGVLGGGGGARGALARGGRGRRTAAGRLVGAGAGEREAAAREARVGEERVGVGRGGARRLGRQPPRRDGAVGGLAHEQHRRGRTGLSPSQVSGGAGGGDDGGRGGICVWVWVV